MNDWEVSLALLQHADSGFPSGALSFSSGLECLISDGMLSTEDDFSALLQSYFEHRWNSFDRVYTVRSFLATSSAEQCALDREVESNTFVEAVRDGSRRAGRALLGAWCRMGDEPSIRYRALVSQGEALGHLCVVQGVVSAGAQLSLEAAQLSACWSTLSGFSSAAVRLGVVGHVGAQRALIKLRPIVARALAVPVDADTVPATWSPMQDIAMTRHAAAPSRLFAT